MYCEKLMVNCGRTYTLICQLEVLKAIKHENDNVCSK